jgi:hypothetical protein
MPTSKTYGGREVRLRDSKTNEVRVVKFPDPPKPKYKTTRLMIEGMHKKGCHANFIVYVVSKREKLDKAAAKKFALKVCPKLNFEKKKKVVKTKKKVARRASRKSGGVRSLRRARKPARKAASWW